MNSDATAARKNTGYSLLEKHAPAVLETLRETFPDYRARFQISGVVLGSEGLRIDILGALTVTQVSLRICSSAMVAGQKTLRQARRFVLAGGLVSSLSGAGLITVVAVDAPKFTEYGAALLTFLGGCLTLVSEYLSRGMGGAQVADAYKELSDSFPRLLSLDARLSGYLRCSDAALKEIPGISELLAEAHTMAARIQTAATVLGVAALTTDQLKACLEGIRATSLDGPNEAHRDLGLKPS